MNTYDFNKAIRPFSDGRVGILQNAISKVLSKKPFYGDWIDVGSGGGKITYGIYSINKKKFNSVTTCDIFPIANAKFKHIIFDGKKLPFKDKTFDLVSFIDVLHHTKNIEKLLSEAKRVSKKYILIKDHIYDNLADHISLHLQDWAGNIGTGCPMLYNYLKKDEWIDLIKELDLKVVTKTEEIDFHYPIPLNILFRNNRHVIYLLQK